MDDGEGGEHGEEGDNVADETDDIQEEDDRYGTPLLKSEPETSFNEGTEL